MSETKTMHKWFWVWEFEKEERWLNEMAQEEVDLSLRTEPAQDRGRRLALFHLHPLAQILFRVLERPDRSRHIRELRHLRRAATEVLVQRIRDLILIIDE